MTEHLHDTTTKQAPTLAPCSTENHLLFSQMLGIPSVLLNPALSFESRSCIFKTVATQHNQSHLRNATGSWQLLNRTTMWIGLECLLEKPALVIVFLMVMQSSQNNCFCAFNFPQSHPVSSALMIYMQPHTTTPPCTHIHTCIYRF